MLSKQKEGQIKIGQGKARQIAILVLWLIVWQLISMLVGNKVLFASPWETLKALVALCLSQGFVKTLLISAGKLTLGFVAGLLLGGILGCLGVKKKWLDALLHPLLSFMKSVPVAAFVVLLLVWWGSRWLSVAIVFVVVFPHIYMAFYEGLGQVDVQLLEVAKVYKMPLWNRAFYVYRKALKPFLDNGLKLSLGLSWKSGVAAEVIGTPDFSIGEGLYMAKIHLNTPEVFAWIVIILALSAIYEKIGMQLWTAFCRWKPACKAPAPASEGKARGMHAAGEKARAVQGAGEKARGAQVGEADSGWELTISKFYGEKVIWDDFKLHLQLGKIYTLQAPSGRGKTTLLRILAGLEANETEIIAQNCAMLFQEDRLLLDETPLTNIETCIGSNRREEIWQHLKELIPELTEDQTCGQLSGGMKRRVCLVRTMLSDAQLLLLDEPFTGLDEETKAQAMDYIVKQQAGRTILLVTHLEKDAKMLNSTHFKI